MFAPLFIILHSLMKKPRRSRDGVSREALAGDSWSDQFGTTIRMPSRLSA